MTSLSNVINVSLLPEGAAVARDNMNVCAIMTSDASFLNSNRRFALYTDAASVAEDFGSTSDASAFANVFFATTPNPINADGVLVMGYWRAADEDVAASPGVLTGEQLSEASVIGVLQSVSDGSFDIDVDGTTQNVTALDFRTTTTLAGVATILDTAISGATVAIDDQRIVITSATTGATSTLTFLTAGSTGTFIGDTLTLSTTSGAVLTAGAAASTLSPETKVEAVTALKSLVNFRGVTFIDNPTDDESKALATWGQANETLSYDVFDSPSNLNVDINNPVWEITLAGQTYYRMQYSKAGNRKLATSYMARMHTVNFQGENTALTMHLKELAVPAEEYTQTEITAARRVGLDLYTTFKNVPKVLTSGANDFTDNPYNLIAYVDAVQTDLFNLLGTTPTKVAQTLSGVNKLVDQCERTTQGFVTAGVFAPGTWTLADTFGDLDTFNRNIETRGFYFLARPLSEQPQASRQNRESPVIQGAVKNAGAIHMADIIINFNL